MIGRLAVFATVVFAAAVAASTPATLALFTSTRSASATFAAGTLQPPTGVAGAGGTTASLTWVASTSSAATGYNLLRSATSGSGYTQVTTVTPVSATSAADSPGAGVWYYVLDTYRGGWESAFSNETAVTIASSTTSTSIVGCTGEGPETANAGNNDGYETNPANACAKDGQVATDANSGTDTTLSCSDPGKDREQFWGYSFGLPGTVSAIGGITVQLVEGLNNNSGTNQVCVQLSWNGGTSWTTPQIVTLNHVPLNTYTVGSDTDTWAHAGWTPSQLNAANFRVRLTDMSSVTSKSFQLDFVGVSVGYTP
jgi:hypothetical protein